MRWLAMLIMAASVARSGEVGVGEDRRTVTVCVDFGDGVHETRLDRVSAVQAANMAQATASRIFAGIGVKIQWYGVRQCPPRDAILVTFRAQTPASKAPGALAYAFPYEGNHIIVLYDRVKSNAEPGYGPCLLAYVLVHEITHILEATNAHSEAGIMKARWRRADQLLMARRRFGFTPLDVEMIQAGLDARPSRLTRSDE